MRLLWQAMEYERSCTECGYTWRVPRSAARQRVRSISGISVTAPKSVSVDQAELARQISSISASNEPAELYRQYPKCGAADFTQRAFRAT